MITPPRPTVGWRKKHCHETHLHEVPALIATTYHSRAALVQQHGHQIGRETMPKPTPLAIQDRPTQNGLESVDLAEKGRSPSGEVLTSNRRLYMQFMAFGGCEDTATLIDALRAAGINGVL